MLLTLHARREQLFSFHLCFTFMLYKLNLKDETTQYVTQSVENFIHKCCLWSYWCNPKVQIDLTGFCNVLLQFDLSFRELHRNLRFFCLLPRIMYFCSSWLTETWHTKKLKWWAVTVFRTFRKIWTLSIVSNFIIKIARKKKKSNLQGKRCVRGWTTKPERCY